jgi:long-chain acyl-CoA synthetase
MEIAESRKMKLDFFEQFQDNVARNPQGNAFTSISSEGRETLTYQEISDEIKIISKYLREQGIKPKDRVGIIMKNHPRWGIAALAVQSVGAIIVPLDILLDADTLAYQLSHSGCSYCFISAPLTDLVKEIMERLENPLPVLVDGSSDLDGAEWNSLMEAGDPAGISLPLVKRNLEEACVIMYTSGTTGNPKGVVLNGLCLSLNANAIMDREDVTLDDHFLCVLPLYHILAFVIFFYAPLYKGCRVTFLDTLEAQQVLKTFKEEKITVFVCVPQFFNLLLQRIMRKVQSLPRLKRTMFFKLLSLSGFCIKYLKFNPGKKFFSMVHDPFGEKFRIFGSGGARLEVEVPVTMTKLGFNFAQAYGMTETGALISATAPNFKGIGTVGVPLEHVEVKIENPDKDGIGEILTRGKNVMIEYYMNPKATSETIEPDGWMHTGDLGCKDKDGFISITGRKKDIIVLSSGINISPDEVEFFYQSRCDYIKEICVVGLSTVDEGVARERLHAVVVPDLDELRKDRVVNAYEIIRYKMETISQQLTSFKRIKSLEIWQEALPRTTTRKVQRFVVERQVRKNLETQTEEGIKEKSEFQSWEPANQLEKNISILIKQVKPNVVIVPDASLELDLGFESLERVELTTNLQEAFNISISDLDTSDLFSVNDIIKMIEGKTEGDEIQEADQNMKSWEHILEEPLDKKDQQMLDIRLKKRFFFSLIFSFSGWLVANIFRIIFRLKTAGIKNIPHEFPYLICPNHVSFLDSVIVFALMPHRILNNLVSLGYYDYFSKGLLGFLGKRIRTIPVDPDKTLRQGLRIAAEGVRRGFALCVFPEGERSIDGKLKKFKKGPAILATILKVPVVPVGIKGAHQVWSRGSRKINLHPISVHFGKPLYPGPDETSEDFNQRLRMAVQELSES